MVLSEYYKGTPSPLQDFNLERDASYVSLLLLELGFGTLLSVFEVGTPLPVAQVGGSHDLNDLNALNLVCINRNTRLIRLITDRYNINVQKIQSVVIFGHFGAGAAAIVHCRAPYNRVHACKTHPKFPLFIIFMI